ncbi:hypothetical protein [Duganella aceris]|uniref:Lipoprotein n=1 Tax=Duganella aceris TaxID=2703883 RepID=A0ABX0FI79_9BURK|nr:hypothetical protein [Duganella aceris]NGZ84225.1 hypothetical protein [Duganella aceris]
MRRFLMLALLLAGCSTVDQSRLGNFVNRTIQPGMPMDQALVRMQTEGFFCGGGADAVISCTRTYDRLPLVQTSCIERVDLVRSATMAKTVGTIDVLEVKCPKK